MSECWKDFLSVVGTIASVGTVAVTYHFYSQLVKNDNRRETRVTRDRLRERLKNELWPNRTAAGALQNTVEGFLRRNPKENDLVLEAWDEILTEARLSGETRLMSRRDFEDALKRGAPTQWPG